MFVDAVAARRFADGRGSRGPITIDTDQTSLSRGSGLKAIDDAVVHRVHATGMHRLCELLSLPKWPSVFRGGALRIRRIGRLQTKV